MGTVLKVLPRFLGSSGLRFVNLKTATAQG